MPGAGAGSGHALPRLKPLDRSPDRVAAERCEKLFEGEEADAGHCAARLDVARCDLSRKKHRSRRGNLGPVAAFGDELPAKAERPAVAIDALDLDVHHAGVAADALEAFAERFHRSRVAIERAHEPGAHEPRKDPQGEMKAFQLEPGAETELAKSGVTPREEIEIRDIASREPARPDRCRVAMTAKRLPAHDGAASVVFEPWQRLTSQRITGAGSTGLGLAIVRSIVDAHGGIILAVPNSGGGLTVTVALP